MAHLLIVDDEPHIRLPLLDYFVAEGYEVSGAKTGEEALEAAAKQLPDCVLLDVMLPGIDGIAVCRELRAQDPFMPIILLTARDAEGERVQGLDSGADDYVTKPFGMLELHARVRSQLRRARRTQSTRPSPEPTRELSLGPCRFDALRRVLSLEGEPVRLSAMELKLLEHFIAHPDQVLPRETLLNEVWGYRNAPSSRTVDTHVYKLRRKIEHDPNQPVHLVTVHGLGYRFLFGEDAGEA